MARGHQEHTYDILQECMEFQTRGNYVELLQTSDALCLYAQLSFIRPKALGVSFGQYPLSLRRNSLCISGHTEVAA